MIPVYNRYIPQSDGSFRRDFVPEPQHRPPPEPQHRPPPEESTHRPPPPPQGSVSGFLRRLLPPDFDTGDLIVVLLLLLLAGDCEEERSTAMLTLVLYLIL